MVIWGMRELDKSDPEFHELESAVEKLKRLTEEFTGRFGLQVSLSRILAVLSDYPCIARCLVELKPRPREPVDHYYLERHEFVRRLLLDTLRIRLLKEGFRVSLKAENQEECGKGDIDLEYTHLGVTVSVNSFRIRVEVKGGVRFPIAQLLRYLLDVNAVVLCLAGRGEAVTLTRNDAKQLIELLLRTITAKLKLLIEGDEARIPGPWCHGCPLECQYAKPPTSHRPDLDCEFVATLKNWRRAIEQTVEHVIDLLKRVKKAPEAYISSCSDEVN